MKFTASQKQRLRELNLNENRLEFDFKTVEERDENFESNVKQLTAESLKRLETLRDTTGRPTLRLVSDKLVNAALSSGFVEVVTPLITSKESILKMGIDRKHALWRQIYWLEAGKCLRPMLAPNLYFLMSRLRNLWETVKIFEIGTCFRKDTKGPQHLDEFTMLNMVEVSPALKADKRLIEIIDYVMRSLNLSYELKKESSDVYGETVDVLVEGVEVASAATGPNPLDANWDIVDPWAGVGFGVERLAMVLGKFNNATRVGRSLIYLNGARLNI